MECLFNAKKIFDDVKTGIFNKRLNRFLVECICENKIIKAHLPNPGRLWELLLAGRKVYLIKEEKRKDGACKKRQTDHTIIAVQKDERPVFLHTHKTNEIARKLIEYGCISELEGFKVKETEYKLNGSRFDFLLKRGNDMMLLEVKSCTLFNRDFAMFPDAVTSRGKRHILELAKSEIPGGILFIVHSEIPNYFLPEYHIDPEFANALYSHRNKILIKAVGIGWHEDLSIRDKIKNINIPWEIYEREGKDRGSYLLILKNSNNRKIKIGKLGDIFFKKGFYVYVGSAMKNLKARVERHKRKRKNMFWHIDYLREEVELINIIPIRSSMRMECDIAKKIKEMADGYVESFGVSDCFCVSHLFYMENHPLEKSTFIDIVLYFRTPSITNMTQS